MIAWVEIETPVAEIAAWIPPCENDCEHLSCEVQREDELTT